MSTEPVEEPQAGESADQRPGITLTREQPEEWVGCPLTDDQVEEIDGCIPNSSIPEAIGAIADQFLIYDEQSEEGEGAGAASVVAELRATYGKAGGLEALYGALTDDRLGNDERAVPTGLPRPEGQGRPHTVHQERAAGASPGVSGAPSLDPGPA
ncbi:hypothetical protein ACFQYP_50805 [Nonomuraea antimicrobica]